jgi:hypothetical protein
MEKATDVLSRMAAIAQLLEDNGLYAEAAQFDTVLEDIVSDKMLQKEAGIWHAIFSRLSGWSKRLLFKEYREVYNSAKICQNIINKRLDKLQDVNAELKEMFARHLMDDWRSGIGTLFNVLNMPQDTLEEYDNQISVLTAKLMSLVPEEEKKEIKKELMETQSGVKKEVSKTKPEVKKPVEVSEVQPEIKVPIEVPEVKQEIKKEVPISPVASQPKISEPLFGWKTERFGSSGKHGWEWEWEVSPDQSKLRIPKNQLTAASAGKGKILHTIDGKYRPTGGTSSIKLRKLMGEVFWRITSDPLDSNMVILEKTDEVVPFPLTTLRTPMEQVEKLKEMEKSSQARLYKLLSFADIENSDENKLDEAAKLLLKGFEEEGEEEE